MPDGSGDPKLKLLVPVNFSTKSEMALDFALRFSHGKNTELYVFHVFEESTKNFRRLDKLNEEYMDRMKQMVINQINRLHSFGLIHNVEDVHRRMAHGRAAQEILQMANAIRADMIIMGAISQGQFKKFATHAPCSLVLLKRKDMV